MQTDIRLRALCSLVCAASVLVPLSSTAAAPGDELGPPPGTYEVLSEDGTIRIPFEIYREDIRMRATINGVEVRLMLDNGFMWDQLLLFGGPNVDALGLEPDGEILVVGSGEGDPIPSTTVSDVTVCFPGVEFSGQTAVVTPSSSDVTRLWEGTEGQISAAFFKHFVVDVDFDDMVITLVKPEEFTPREESTEVAMKHLGRGAFAVLAELEVGDSKVLKRWLQLDLGCSNPLSLVTGGEDGIPLPQGAVEDSLGFGVQGEIKGHYGRVRSFTMAGHTIPDVLAAFVPQSTGGPFEERSMIGLPVLSRFDVAFDYPGHRMFITPNRRFAEPFVHNMSGLRLRRTEAGLTVHRVYPASPAAEAGLEVGDVILEIDGRPAAELGRWEVMPIFRTPGSSVRLKVEHDGTSRTVTLTLRRIV